MFPPTVIVLVTSKPLLVNTLLAPVIIFPEPKNNRPNEPVDDDEPLTNNPPAIPVGACITNSFGSFLPAAIKFIGSLWATPADLTSKNVSI